MANVFFLVIIVLLVPACGRVFLLGMLSIDSEDRLTGKQGPKVENERQMRRKETNVDNFSICVCRKSNK